MNFIDNYILPKYPFTYEDILNLLKAGSELKRKNGEMIKEIKNLKEEIEELEEKLEENCRETEELKRDPRKCDCGYKSDYVLIHGRCSSCM